MTTISEIMTPNPVSLGLGATAADAAREMRDHGIGDVLVTDGTTIRGIVTDRDLVTRVLAEGGGADSPLSACLSDRLVSAAPDDSVESVVELMRANAVRRVPVLHDGTAVGIVSIGDLAISQDEHSALADISKAPTDS